MQLTDSSDPPVKLGPSGYLIYHFTTVLRQCNNLGGEILSTIPQAEIAIIGVKKILAEGGVGSVNHLLNTRDVVILPIIWINPCARMWG